MKFVMALALCIASCACGGNDATSPSSRTPDYAGSWSGSYTITGCTQSGGVALANICGNLGATPPYSFSLTQSGTNVSGSFALGSVSFPNVGGTVRSDGSLSLQGTSVSNGITVVVTWALNMPANALTGTITQQWTSTGLSGSATVTGNINTAIRSAASRASIVTPAFLSSTNAGELARAMAK
jgi:hypothetical protein